jgi:integrase
MVDGIADKKAPRRANARGRGTGKRGSDAQERLRPQGARVSAPLQKTKVPGVYRRGGRYVVLYRDPYGRQRSRAASTLAEARLLKSALAADVARGEYRALSGVTFAEYFPEWIASYAGRTSRGFREQTRQEYKRDLQRHALPFFGPMKLAEVEPRDVKRFIGQLIGLGLTSNSVRRRMAPVRTLFATAVEDGLIRSNPTSRIRIPRSPADRTDDQEPAKALTEHELARLLDEVPREWRLFVEFLAHTGLRFSEAIGIRWSDIDVEGQRLRVRRRLYHGVDAPKSRYGRRDIPLAPRMLDALQQQRRSSSYGDEDDPVFATRAGTPLDYACVYGRVFKPAARRAGVPWAAFHTLRHTCATMLFRNGLNAKQVQMWLGHHSPAFTLAVYVHLLADDLPDPDFLDTLTGPERREEAAPSEVAEQAAVLDLTQAQRTGRPTHRFASGQRRRRLRSQHP